MSGSGVQLLVSGAIIAYLLWQIDVGKTIDLIRASNGWELLPRTCSSFHTVGMAWRWSALLASKGIQERLAWLTKLYFMGYAAGQILPTAIGGDAVRITAHARRVPDRGEGGGRRGRPHGARPRLGRDARPRRHRPRLRDRPLRQHRDRHLARGDLRRRHGRALRPPVLPAGERVARRSTRARGGSGVSRALQSGWQGPPRLPRPAGHARRRPVATLGDPARPHRRHCGSAGGDGGRRLPARLHR